MNNKYARTIVIVIILIYIAILITGANKLTGLIPAPEYVLFNTETMQVEAVGVEIKNIKVGDTIFTERYMGTKIDEDTNAIFHRAIITIERR